MSYAMAGAAALQVMTAGYAAAQQGLNEARRIKAQNAARIKQMQHQFDMNTQNLFNNNEAIKQNKMKNDMRIEEGKLQAEDAFAQAFVGSGISGRTKDIQAAELQSQVDKAHVESANIASQETDRQFLGLMRNSQAISQKVEDMVGFDTSANSSNINMAMLSAGVSSASSLAQNGVFDSFFDKK